MRVWTSYCCRSLQLWYATRIDHRSLAPLTRYIGDSALAGQFQQVAQAVQVPCCQLTSTGVNSCGRCRLPTMIKRVLLPLSPPLLVWSSCLVTVPANATRKRWRVESAMPVWPRPFRLCTSQQRASWRTSTASS
jgi:hypothetical protein